MASNTLNELDELEITDMTREEKTLLVLLRSLPEETRKVETYLALQRVFVVKDASKGVIPEFSVLQR